MTYDPTGEGFPTARDLARMALGDTSNAPATELFADAEYDAMIAQFVSWCRAAAFMARSLAARQIPISPTAKVLTGFTATGRMAATWQQVKPGATWLQVAAALEAQCAAMDAGPRGPLTIRTQFLTNVCEPGGEF